MSLVRKRESCLIYKGSSSFRMRLILSILSGRPVKIDSIRSLDDNPGLREYEVNLIRLLDKITNGTVIELNHTGTCLYFQPGVLIGGDVNHECCKLRAISYYLEVLIAVAPFCKKPINCILRGVTNAHNEISVDSMISGVIPVLQRFLVVNDGLSLKVLKRGMAPEGGGEIHFSCPARKSLRPIQFTDMGKIKRIRGIAYAARVSPNFANRIVETAKGVLLNFLPDVYINTDHSKGDKAGKSSGFGISLNAETTTGVFLTCDKHCVIPGHGVEPTVPEDLGREAGNLLLEEIYRGGCVSSSFQSLATLWMVLTQKDISKFMTGPLSPYTINFLRHVQDFFGLTFKIDTKAKEEDEEIINDGATKVILTCIGIGLWWVVNSTHQLSQKEALMGSRKHFFFTKQCIAGVGSLYHYLYQSDIKKFLTNNNEKHIEFYGECSMNDKYQGCGPGLVLGPMKSLFPIWKRNTHWHNPNFRVTTEYANTPFSGPIQLYAEAYIYILNHLYSCDFVMSRIKESCQPMHKEK